MTVTVQKIGNYVLGLELGVASLGWAALSLDENEKPSSILAVGARRFPVGTVGDIASGRDASRNQRRQQARGRRVQLARRIERLRSVWTRLQDAGLLPPGRFKDRDGILKSFDRETGNKAPYVLRAKALDEALKPWDLGRAIYHIAQRRGFQSNRRQAARDDEELGVVKQGISDLEEAMRAAGSRTLGEYFAGIASTPIRRRWTARAMYMAEFQAIVDAQRPHHAEVLTGGFCKRLAQVLFAQRALKSQSRRIGRCELEPSRRRMPLASLDAQEFRVLQRVNDLRLVDDVGAEPILLTESQRDRLIDILRDGDATFASIRKALGLPKTVRFNAERIDEKTLIGFRTEARMRRALADRWTSLDQNKRRALVDEILSIDEDIGLQRRLVRHWGLSADQADAVLHTPLELGHLGHSHKAVARLLGEMRGGAAYATARAKLYPSAGEHEIVRRLPLVRDAYPHLANPLVNRALGEVRAVVNAIISKYGRPRAVRVSLMRDLRLGRKSRERLHIKMRQQQKVRANGIARILKDMGVQDPPRWMVDKVLLADECGWVCPFSGKPMSMRSLIGGDARVEVVHIIPFHQSLDDSFENKTLCHVNVRPDPKALRRVDEKTTARFEKFAGPFAKEKLRRLLLPESEIAARYESSVVAAHFVDSCYASKLVVDYVGRLFPHSSGDVTATRGAITNYVREACGLNRIDLPRGSFKRHAIDAVAVAISGPHIVRTLCSAALAAPPGRRRLAPEIVMPWARFAEDVARNVDEFVVSVRVNRRVSGALHEETFYSKPYVDGSGKTYHTTRKHLWQLTTSDLESIDGDATRQRVVDQLKDLGGGDPRKVFAIHENLPTVNGVAMRRVRVRRSEQAFPIGKNSSQRWVVTEENHHAALFSREGKDGKVRFDRLIVSQFEAQRRLGCKEPLVQFPADATPVATFAVGDTLRLDNRFMTVRSVSKDPRISLVACDDGRTLAEVITAKALVRLSVDQLCRRGAQKVTITPIGEVRTAND